MKRILLSVFSIFLLCNISFAQSDLNFTSFKSFDDLQTQFTDINNAIYGGMNVLDWTDGSGPTLFRISAGLFVGVGKFSANDLIGVTSDGYSPAGVGVQAGFGTAGFEAYARYFPKTDVQGLKLNSLGFGLKYEITKLIPVPLFPSTSIYVDYNTIDFGLNDTRDVYTSDTHQKIGTVNAGIDMGFKSVNVGAIISYDLLLLRIFGKVAFQSGNTDMNWVYATSSNGSVLSENKSGTLTDSGLRIAAGVAIFGIRAEVGSSSGNLFAGLGYGISL